MAFDNKKKLGIIGGGQLGRMLIQSAIDFDFIIHALDPDPEASCVHLAHHFVTGSLTDYQTVYDFGKDMDLITIEIEHINTAALKDLEKLGIKVFPQPGIVEIIQDKRLQKSFFEQNGIPTAEFVLVDDRESVKNHLEFLPAVNKVGKGGYDGKGVQILRGEADASKAFDAPGLLEKLIDFDKELAVIVARSESGEVRTFPVVEMAFHPEANLVEYLFAPADIDASTAEKAAQIAIKTAEAFGIVGLLAVEMFLTQSGDILVNEVAPRPHNSGHQSQRANFTSQFEQHLRAIFDLPLGETGQIAPAAMVNLLGADGYTGEAIYEGMEEIMKVEGVHPFLYGKSKTKPFRKMGHVTIIDSDFEKLKEKVNFVKKTLRIIS